MSEEQTLTDAPQDQTETILPSSITVVIDDETYTIKKFSLAKMLKSSQLISEIVRAAKGDVELNVVSRNELGEVQTNFVELISKVIEMIPRLLAEGSIPLYKLLGLTITPNKEFKKMSLGDTDVEAELLERGQNIAFDGEAEDAMAVLQAALQMAGTETILKNVGPLVRIIRSVTS